MAKYYYKVHVTGRGSFPMDQLRRYEMFPLDVDACKEISYSFRPDQVLTKFEINLGMYASTLGADASMTARFLSFGWSAWTVEIWKDDDLFWTQAGGYEGDRTYAEAYGDVS